MKLTTNLISYERFITKFFASFDVPCHSVKFNNFLKTITSLILFSRQGVVFIVGSNLVAHICVLQSHLNSPGQWRKAPLSLFNVSQLALTLNKIHSSIGLHQTYLIRHCCSKKYSNALTVYFRTRIPYISFIPRPSSSKSSSNFNVFDMVIVDIYCCHDDWRRIVIVYLLLFFEAKLISKKCLSLELKV